MAEEATLDLVQVTDSDPIVCKIMEDLRREKSEGRCQEETKTDASQRA
jgi:translation initiation factor IF-3